MKLLLEIVGYCSDKIWNLADSTLQSKFVLIRYHVGTEFWIKSEENSENIP
jgi:hypothetical protein